MAMLPPWSGRVPADAALPGSSSSSRHTPIHKQEVHAGGGGGGGVGSQTCAGVARDRGMTEGWRRVCGRQGARWIDEAAGGGSRNPGGRCEQRNQTSASLAAAFASPLPPTTPPHPVPPSLPHPSVAVSPSGRAAFERLKTEIFF